MKYKVDHNAPLNLRPVESEIRRFCRSPRSAKQISARLRGRFRTCDINMAISRLVTQGLLRAIPGSRPPQYQWCHSARGRTLPNVRHEKDLSSAIYQDRRRGRSWRGGAKIPPEGTHTIRPFP